MKTGDIIKEKRISCGLTQEQIASALGVSAPAVNKWERGVTLPDVTLFPPLARLLKTDPNTLLGFRQELSEKEINKIVNRIIQMQNTEGSESACNFAMSKIHEYPNCDSLILSVALTLDGLIISHGADIDSSMIEELYERASLSQNTDVSGQAKAMLIARYINRNEHDKANRLIDTLQDEPPYNKKQLRANLYIRQGRLDEAAEIMERQLLSMNAEINGKVLSLIEIAVKQGRYEDAEHMIKVSGQFSKVFDLWEFSTYGAMFQFAVWRLDEAECIATLQKMIAVLFKPWNISASPLYRHISPKDTELRTGEKLLPKIISELENPQRKEYSFLRSSPDFQEWMRDIKERYNLL